MTDKPVIFFDGVCNLCNGFVQFIIKHDKYAKFRFAALQSDFAKQELSKKNITVEELSSVILLTEKGVFTKSTAALKIASQLNGFWKAAYIFIIIPKFIRDFVYDTIAKNRYKWFGKDDHCMVPTPELKERFLA
jgi:predicted DCC family thiol-disulfide oxidoreductase YuxK